MIAHDTGHEYIDEFDFGMEDSLYGLALLFHNRRYFVIQCPALCRHVHMFSADDTAVILMRRNVEDIIASQERIGWPWEWLELARYDRTDGVIAEVKYQFWEEIQRKQIKHAFEIAYESLAEHPLWVPEHLRQGFRVVQTAYQDEYLATSPNACPRPRLGVSYLDDLGNGVAVLVKGPRVKLLNETGRLIWTLCDGTRTRWHILQSLKTHFDDVEADVLARDLDEFIDDLVKKDFLRLSSNPNAVPANRQVSES